MPITPQTLNTAIHTRAETIEQVIHRLKMEVRQPRNGHPTSGYFPAEFDQRIEKVAGHATIFPVSIGARGQFEVARLGDSSIELYIREANSATTWPEFCAANADGYSAQEFAEVRSKLLSAGSVKLGGGAAPTFTLIRTSPLLSHRDVVSVLELAGRLTPQEGAWLRKISLAGAHVSGATFALRVLSECSATAGCFEKVPVDDRGHPATSAEYRMPGHEDAGTEFWRVVPDFLTRAVEQRPVAQAFKR